LRRCRVKGGRQLVDAVRLQQNADTDCVRLVCGGLRIPSGRDDGQVGAPSAYLAREVDPVHAAGHHEVGEDDVDGPSVGQSAERRGSGCRPGHLVAQLIEHLARQRCDFVVVLDQQDAAAIASRLPLGLPQVEGIPPSMDGALSDLGK
jgi:hypothetical protein